MFYIGRFHSLFGTLLLSNRHSSLCGT